MTVAIIAPAARVSSWQVSLLLPVDILEISPFRDPFTDPGLSEPLRPVLPIPVAA